jgi:vitamin B12 transporter
MNYQRLALCSAAASAIAAGAACAQEVFDLGTIVVSPNRTPTEINRTGTSVSVITEDDIRAAGDVPVVDLLQRLPGVTFTQNGPFGNAANLRIRGADQRYVAVYIDGIRVADPSLTQTGFDFGSLLSSDIARIEVLRGSQSALYGGSAVGGVVSITTRRATEEGFYQEAAAEAGSYGTIGGSYGFAYKSGRFDAALSISSLYTDGFSAASAGTEDDGARATRFNLNAGYELTDSLYIGFAGFYQDTWQEYDGFDPVTFVLTDLDNEQDRREAGARIYAEYDAGATVHTFEITGYGVDRDFDESGVQSSFEGRRIGAGWTATTEVSSDLALVYGIDAYEERARYTNIRSGEESIADIGAYVQSLWSPTDTLDVTASYRYDDNNDYGGFDTGRIAVAWRPAPGTTVRGAIATGFRAPSLDELYGDYPLFGFVGNPALEPEESESYEIGIEQEFANGAILSATLYRLNIDNLINFQFGVPTSTLVNLPGQSVRQGVEIGGTLPIGDRVSLNLAYTYIDAQDPSGGQLTLIPKHDLVVGVEAEVTDRLTAEFSIQYVADRLGDFPVAPMDDYTLANANFTYDLGEGRAAYLRVVNIFDEDYELVPGYNTSGQAFYVGLRATF